MHILPKWLHLTIPHSLRLTSGCCVNSLCGKERQILVTVILALYVRRSLLAKLWEQLGLYFFEPLQSTHLNTKLRGRVRALGKDKAWSLPCQEEPPSSSKSRTRTTSLTWNVWWRLKSSGTWEVDEDNTDGSTGVNGFWMRPQAGPYPDWKKDGKGQVF